MSDKNSVSQLATEFALLLDPIAEAAALEPQPYGFLLILEEAGFDLQALLVDPNELNAIVSSIAQAYESVRTMLLDRGVPTSQQLPELLSATGAVVNAINGLRTLRLKPEAPVVAADIPRIVLDFCVLEHLRQHRHTLYQFLAMFGIVVEADLERRVPGRFLPERLVDWIRDPSEAARAANGWGTAEFDADVLLQRLAHVLRGLGLLVIESLTTEEDREQLGEGTPEDRESYASTHLDIPLVSVGHEAAHTRIGLRVMELVATAKGADGGLGIVPYGTGHASVTEELGERLTFRFGANTEASTPFGLVARPGTFAVRGLGGEAPPTRVSLDTSLLLDRGTPAEAATLFGQSGVGRIQFTNIGLRAAFEHDTKKGTDFVVAFPVTGQLQLQPPGDDGFLGHLLPASGTTAPFNVEVGWSLRDGLFVGGRGALEATIPIGRAIPGLRVDSATYALGAGNGEIPLSVAITGSADLGPVHASIDKMGVKVTLSLPDEGGNLGPMHFDVGFRPPSGVAISIDGGSVHGGGYLFFNPDKAQYAGAVQLQFEKFALNATGLLNTRMPNGARGFSLLLMITAEDFAAINLGLGFRLTGVGGLLGFNRGVAVDVLRTGLKNKTLDAVLFPENPVRQASTIVETAGRVFPPTPGQHFVGPVGEVTWGTDGLLTAQVGLVLEFPSPLRLVLLGQMRARFPSQDNALVRLNLDLFGAVDLDRGEAIVLATLFDSRLLEWSVSGDAAFFARWKQNPEFILSAGGFHPAYPAPPELPSLERLAMVLSEGDNVRLRMAWYLALTSNTLQYGSYVDLHVSAVGFSIDGHLGYDALVQFDPFGFTVSFTAGVGLKWHGHTLAGVQLDGTLAGPSPWHVHGKATFKIWRFSQPVRFDATIGRQHPLPPPPVVDPLPALITALSDPASWDAALPEREDTMATLRTGRIPGVVLVHPLGKVSVRQQVVPLEVPVAKFGTARLAAPRTFRISRVDVDGRRVPEVTSEVGHFAVGQFQDLSQAERLARPSFESMQAGVRIDAGQLSYGGRQVAAHMRSTTIAYQTALVTDEPIAKARAVVMTSVYVPRADRLLEQSEFGAAARSRVRAAVRFRTGVSPRVQAVAVGGVARAEEIAFTAGSTVGVATP